MFIVQTRHYGKWHEVGAMATLHEAESLGASLRQQHPERPVRVLREPFADHPEFELISSWDAIRED